MIRDIKLPEISENIDTAEVLNVLVSEGDQVEEEQPVAEMETEKAVFEVPSPVAGKITEIQIQKGQEVKVGEVIAKVETEGEEKGKGKKEKEEKGKGKKEKGEEEEGGEEEKEAEEKEAEDRKPEAGEQEQEAEEREKAKEEEKGRKQKDEEDKEIEEDEKEDETEEEEKEEKKKEDKDQEEEEKEIEEEQEDESEQEIEEEPEEVEEEEEPSKAPVPAAPSVRALARDLGVAIQDVKGTGVGGRISAEDVKKHTKEIVKKGGGAPSTDLPDFSQWGEIRREAMTKVRKLTAENLVASWSSTPQVTHFDQADVTHIEEFRQKYSKEVEAQDGKLTVTSILLQIVARALQVFPRFNASVDMRNREIIYKSYINIGIAVDTERGLLVPVVKNADQKNLTELSVELTDLAERTRTKKVKPDELEGGNFTISNLGGIGGTYFTPVIYAPQVAILGISRSSWQPTVTKDGIESRMILPLTLTYDHRIIDGADGARFLKWIVQVLEDPFRSFLETGV